MSFVPEPVSQDRTVAISKRRHNRPGLTPWLLLLAVLGAAALVGFYGFEKWQTTVEALAATGDELSVVRQHAAEADQRAMEARAALTRAETDFDSERGRLEADADKQAREADALAAKLENIVGADEGQLVRGKDDKLTLELVDKVLFRSGEAELTENGVSVLSQVGDALKAFPDKQVWIYGHTDDVPIANDRFASNWELSSTRALTVVHYLQDAAGIDPRRLAAVGFGEYRPVSPRKKRRNRRIEIVLFPTAVEVVRD